MDLFGDWVRGIFVYNVHRKIHRLRPSARLLHLAGMRPSRAMNLWAGIWSFGVKLLVRVIRLCCKLRRAGQLTGLELEDRLR